MGKIVPVLFGVVGIVLFLVATDILQATGETELVQGSFGLITGFAGVVGSLLGRRKLWMAFLFGFAFAFISLIGLVVFYMTIWPNL